MVYKCYSRPVEHRISVGQLRQNPTAMLRAVRGGAVYTVTDRGDAIADISPHRPGPWRPAAAVEGVLRRLGPDQDWLGEQQLLRHEAVVRDPFESHE